MMHRRWMGLGGFVFLLGVAVAWSQEPAPENSPPAPAGVAPSSRPETAQAVDAARDKAKLMHSIYTTTLDVMHHRYFRGDRASVPARAMEDVFTEIAQQSKIQSRWIGVNARVMGLNHEPKDDFEKEAAAALGAGKGEWEQIAEGHYRRAAAVPLNSGCLSCHGTFGFESKTPRYAGLVIDIPLNPAEDK